MRKWFLWMVVSSLALLWFAKPISQKVAKTEFLQQQASAEACAACHEEIVAEWRESMHAKSWTNPVFQAEFRSSSSQYCRDCHAPQTKARDRRELDGVDCSVCHTGHGFRPKGSHACKNCHQFNFPSEEIAGKGRFEPTEPLQNTFNEWMESHSARKGETCQDCHMPLLTGSDGQDYRSHRFGGFSDKSLLSQAVHVELKARRKDGFIHVQATLAPGHIGHSFPTGDMYRQGNFSVWVDPQAKQHRELQRYFAYMPAADGKSFRLRQVDDTRVPPPGNNPLEFEFSFVDEEQREINWSLDLYRMPDAMRVSRGLPEQNMVVHVAEGASLISDN